MWQEADRVEGWEKEGDEERGLREEYGGGGDGGMEDS